MSGDGAGSNTGDGAASDGGSASAAAPDTTPLDAEDGVGADADADAAVADAEVGATVDGDLDRDPDAPTIELRRVRKEYETGAGTVVALDDVEFAVRPGEFVAVVGPSGSGKSTLLNVLGLLDTPTSGLRLLRGRDVTDLDDETRTRARKSAIGFVFQDFFLIPSLTATENVELPTLFGEDPTATDRARDLLTRVGLGDRLDHTPNELSGGQKQRVAIARALINRPAVVLADEPTGNLDSDTGAQVLEEFRRICETGVSVIAVTHDDLVTEYADRTVELIDGRLGEAQR